MEVALVTTAGTSIDDMASHLLRRELVKSRKDQDERLAARSIAFAILGWQTMLYQPALGTCPLQLLAIADVMDGYNGQAFMKFRQDQSTIKRPLSDFLLGFGLMLPKENICVSEDPEDCQAYEKVDIVRPEELNASLLHQLARIEIEWVDVMAPHLEFDKATNKLYLFRHPSFCLVNVSLREESDMRSMIYQSVCFSRDINVTTDKYSCATQDEDNAQWASEIEISQLLLEILLSYRLLFGQNKESRKIFKEMSSGADDITLQRLCSSKEPQFSELFKERDFYRLKRDFPILRCRLATLNHQISNMKPRGWKELWKDKRDSAHWLTFWAVIVIGGAGLLLSLIQVLLQAVQLGHP
jgi:hypothetical protein